MDLGKIVHLGKCFGKFALLHSSLEKYVLAHILEKTRSVHIILQTTYLIDI